MGESPTVFNKMQIGLPVVTSTGAKKKKKKISVLGTYTDGFFKKTVGVGYQHRLFSLKNIRCSRPTPTVFLK